MATAVIDIPVLEGDPLKRYEWAVLLGLDSELAASVAADDTCDLHLAAKLLGQDCPAAVAVELATPVR